ncbi:MAG: DUF126 domain-containing protein [Thaumarchaeota archaeon]|nr:DUF126 domain-containing protein [Nitrososphaerota archaeon]
MSKIKKFKIRWISFKEFEGEVIKSSTPISFLGGIDPKTGIITDSTNSLYGKSIKNKVLLMPFGIGSTVGSYIIYALKKNLTAPIAVITYKSDVIVPSGCAISRIPYGLLSYNDWLEIEDHALIKTEKEDEILVSL